MSRSDVRALLAELGGRQNHWALRFSSELEFAEALARVQGCKSWASLIDKAAAVVEAVIRGGRADKLEAAVRQAEAMLAAIGRAAKRYTLHLIGHAHIDMNWMWPWPETVATTNDTFTTVLKLMDEFDDFTFTQSQASVYALMQEHNPELFEQIRRRVAQGRWEVAAAMWVEGDKNIVCGESLVRHLLYARRYFRENFNLSAEDLDIDWEPDTFGHAATIPTIVSGGGVRSYYLGRFGGGPADRPRMFWWSGPDGARVLVSRGIGWYNGRIDPDYAMRGLEFCTASGLTDALCPYGIGDHGGGPTRRDLLRAIDMNGWPIYPNFRFSTVRRFYEIVHAGGAKLPTISGELNFEFTGCYTSQSRIKKTNRQSEAYLAEAESAATLAWRAVGRDYPGAALRRAWIDTLFGHFHDILPGSCVAGSREYHLGQFQRIAATTSQVKTQALRALAGAIDTSFAGEPDRRAVAPERASVALGGGAGRGADAGGLSHVAHVIDGFRPFVVFNPIAGRRRQVVTATIWGDCCDEADAGCKFLVRLPGGRTVAAQLLGKGEYWAHSYADIAFPMEVGPLGWSACAADQGEAPIEPTVAVAGSTQYQGGGYRFVGDICLENEHLRARLDRLTGGVVELIDKSTGRNVADAANPLGVLEYVLERPRGMNAWLIGQTQRCDCPLDLAAFDVTAQGPHVASVRARLKVNQSPIAVDYILRGGQRWLEISVSMTWLERGGKEDGIPSLRMRFPLALAGAKGRYEVPFGSVQRDLNGGEEVPALRWADVTGTAGTLTASAAGRGGKSPLAAGRGEHAGCLVLNDCKHGHSLDGSTLRVSLVRSTYEPDPLPEIGEHTMRLAVVPHGRPLPEAEMTQLAAEFNHPLQVVSTDVHAGRLAPNGQAVAAVRPGNVLLVGIKKAEDEDAVILRLQETAGKASAARVQLDPALLGRGRSASQVDLLERPLDTSSAKLLGSTVTVKVPARGIASVRIKF